MLILRMVLLLIFLLPINGLANEESSITPIGVQPNNQEGTISSDKKPHSNNSAGESLKPHIPQQISQQYGQQTDTKAAKNQRWYNNPLEILLTLFNGLLALFTFLLWRSTIKLWEESQEHSRHLENSVAISREAADAAEASAQVAKETLTSTHRAFVFLKDIKFKEIRGKGYSSMPSNDQITFVFYPCWGNSGNTPTKNLIINMGCKITSQDDLPDNFEYRFVGESDDIGYQFNAFPKDINLMIGPKAEITISPIIIGALLYPASMITEQGVINIFIWGQAEYDDVFEQTSRHITRFCVKLFFTKQRGEEPLMSLVYYGKYNCADKDCDEQQ